MTEPWLSVSIPGPAVPKARPRLGRGGHTYTPERTRDWEAWVAFCVAEKYRLPEPDRTTEYAVEMRFYLKSRRRSDGDNLAKGCLDALNRVVWWDDSQVIEVHYRVYRGASEDLTHLEVYRATCPEAHGAANLTAFAPAVVPNHGDGQKPAPVQGKEERSNP